MLHSATNHLQPKIEKFFGRQFGRDCEIVAVGLDLRALHPDPDLLSQLL